MVTALQNAFFHLMRSDFEGALMATVARGGDTDTNAAIAGALLGAAYGREAIPARWIRPVLACRPLVEAGAPRPRPMPCWPDDVLELAEACCYWSDLSCRSRERTSPPSESIGGGNPWTPAFAGAINLVPVSDAAEIDLLVAHHRPDHAQRHARFPLALALGGGVLGRLLAQHGFFFLARLLELFLAHLHFGFCLGSGEQPGGLGCAQLRLGSGAAAGFAGCA